MAERTSLLDLLAEHRMNAVVDPRPDQPAWTRVKCDGGRCEFYAEGERYWDVVKRHDEHLAQVLTEAAPLPMFIDYAEQHRLVTSGYSHGFAAILPLLPALRAKTAETIETVICSVYGTDGRHGVMARRVVEHVFEGKPIPWKRL